MFENIKLPDEIVYWIRDFSGAGASISAIDAGFQSVTESSFLAELFGITTGTVYPLMAVLGVVFLFSMTYAYGQ